MEPEPTTLYIQGGTPLTSTTPTIITQQVNDAGNLVGTSTQEILATNVGRTLHIISGLTAGTLYQITIQYGDVNQRQTLRLRERTGEF